MRIKLVNKAIEELDSYDSRSYQQIVSRLKSMKDESNSRKTNRRYIKDSVQGFEVEVNDQLRILCVEDENDKENIVVVGFAKRNDKSANEKYRMVAKKLR